MQCSVTSALHGAWPSAAPDQGTVRVVTAGPRITAPGCVPRLPTSLPPQGAFLATGSLGASLLPLIPPEPSSGEDKQTRRGPGWPPRAGWEEQDSGRCSLTRSPWLCLIKIVKY